MCHWLRYPIKYTGYEQGNALGHLGPTKEILEYDMKLRENVRQREQLKQELAELEKKPRGIFRAIVIIGIIILCIAAATA